MVSNDLLEFQASSGESAHVAQGSRMYVLEILAASRPSCECSRLFSKRRRR